MSSKEKEKPISDILRASDSLIKKGADLNKNQTKNLDELLKKLSTYGPEQISKVLASNNTIRRVRLDNCSLRDPGATHIANTLKLNKVITSLSVAHNFIGEKGAAALADAITENLTLKILNASQNYFGNAGARYFGNMLKINQSLRIIQLSDCQIGVDGATALAASLKENKSLESLHMNGSEAGDRGALAFSEALKVNSVLRVLSLCFCEITDSGAQTLATSLKENKKSAIRVINLDGNAISSKILLKIRKRVAKNSSGNIDMGLTNRSDQRPSTAKSRKITEYIRGALILKGQKKTKGEEEEEKGRQYT